jgi:hypothetical protein
MTQRSQLAGGNGSILLASLLVAASALHFLGGNVADPDLWGHLRYGQMILDGHGLPREDVFSYTAPGAPFYDHEWLSDLVFASLFAVAGSAGLIALKLVAGAVMLLAMLDAMRSTVARLTPDAKPHPLMVAVVLIAALAVIHPGATFRPQLFTMVFLALEMALLLRAERRYDAGVRLPAEIAVLPPLFLVWANLHGGFLVGVGLFGIYCAVRIGDALLARERGRDAALTHVQALALALVGVLALAAPLVNPYGLELYTYLAETLHMHGEISEWYPVTLLSTEFLRFKVLCLATVLAAGIAWRTQQHALASQRSPLLWMVPFVGVAALSAFRHQRHTVLFGIVAAPLLVVAAEQTRRTLLARWPDLAPRRPVFVAAACGALVVALGQLAGFAAQTARDGLTIRYGRLDYPVDAVEFLRANDLGGNVAMPFEWGAFAIAKLAPDAKVFIDGRFEAVYPKQVIDDYFAFMHGTEGWERLLDDYPTDVVVVQRWRQIHPRLFAHPDFVYVYSDPASLVFVRRSPENDPTLTRLASLADRTDFPRHETVFP